MGRQMPWDKIPDSNVFPTGTFMVSGVKMEERESSNGKLMYAIDVQVLDHPATMAYTNMHYFNNFVIGSDDDPMAELEGTWVQSFGAKRIKQMVAAAQITEKADMDKIQGAFPGCQFMLSLRWYREPDVDRQGLANQYAGQERNDISGFAKIGAKEPSIEVAAKTGVKAPAVPAAPPAAPAAPPPSGQGPVVGQAVPVQPAVAPAPVVPAVQPAPQVVGQPVQPMQPVQPVAPIVAAQPAPVLAQVGAQVATLPCSNCQQQIPTTEFAEHFQSCMAGKG